MRRTGLEINDAHGARPSIRHATVALVRRQAQTAVHGDLHARGPRAVRKVGFVVLALCPSMSRQARRFAACLATRASPRRLILAGFRKNRLACIVPTQLVVFACDQKLRLSGRGKPSNSLPTGADTQTPLGVAA